LRKIHPDIFKDFGISVNKCYKIRGAYICETNKGTKVIRKSDYTPTQINLQHSIKEHLIERGFSDIDRLYLSKKNIPYTVYYNRVFVMNDWQNAIEIDFYNQSDIHYAIKVLAQMHIAGEGFNTLGNDVREAKIKNIGITYEKRYKETIKLKKRISNAGNKTDFEVLYFKNAHEYMELQEMGMGLFHKEDYKKLIELARDKQTIAHHQYTYHNIKKINKDHVIVSGFEKSGYDVQLTDLVYIIKRIMQKNQWDVDLLLKIIDAYNTIKPLSPNEWTILQGMIIFPDKFSKLCNTYYYSKRRWNYNMFYRKLTNMLEYKDTQIKCAKEIFRW